MSCYFRHLNEIFDEAGIAVTPSNRKQIDHAIHQIVGVSYKDCPQAWRNLKQQIISDEQKRQEFIKKLQTTLD
jgi:hypothetical protein